MIVRSCRLLLWGCSSRFVLAKMLLEHIAAEEGKRLFADDKEQAAHLMTLKSAADQAPSQPWDQQVGEVLPYSSSASSIFSPFDQIDKYGVTQYSNPDTDIRGDLNPFEATQPVGTTSKRYHNETAEKGGRTDLSCASISKKKRAVGGGGNGNANRGRLASDMKARPAQLASSSSASSILAAVDSQNRQSFFNQKQQMTPSQSQLSLDSSSNRTEFLNFEAVDALYQNNQINYMPHSQQPPPVMALGSSVNFPPRSLSEKSMLRANMGMCSNSGSVHSMTPMLGVGSSSWTTDGSAMDCPVSYDAPPPSMGGYTHPLVVGSLSHIAGIASSYGSLTDLSRMQHTDFSSCKIAPPNEQPRMWQQQQDLLFLQKGQQK
jgi:hypothetical protein